MNRLITLLCLLILNVNGYAQIDFFKFIESIKWSSTENEIIKQYSTLIKRVTHDVNENEASERNYGINQIMLNHYNFNASFYVNITTKKLVYILFEFQQTDSGINKSSKITFDNLDALLTANYGEPFLKEDGIINYRKFLFKNILIDAIHHSSPGCLLKFKQLDEIAFKELQREERIKAKYGDTIGQKIIDRKYWIGMTSEMAKESLGIPDDINRTVGSWGVHEQWVYSNKYLYFEDGILTSYQNEQKN